MTAGAELLPQLYAQRGAVPGCSVATIWIGRVRL